MTEGMDSEPLLGPTLWRHKWLIAASVVALGLGALFFSSLQDDEFASRAQVFLADPAGAGAIDVGGPRGARYVTSQAQLIESDVVSDIAAESLGTTTADVARSVTATGLASSDVISIVAARKTAAGAADYANAVAAAYETVRLGQVEESVTRSSEAIEEVITELQDRLDALVAADGPETGIEVTVERLEAQESELSQLNIDARRFGSGVLEVEAGDVPSSRIAPKPLRDALIGAVLGLVIAVGVVWWRQSYEPRADDRNDPAAILEAPLLAEVPVFEPSEGQAHIAQSDTPAAAAFEFALSALGLILSGGASPLLVVTSGRPNDGKTLTALNLAAASVADGRNSLLIDADERARGLSTLVGADDSAGLTDLAATEGASVGDFVQTVVVGDISLELMTAGSPPADTAGFFRSQGFRKGIVSIRSAAEFIIVDTPPILAVADTVSIASQADGVILVVDRGTPTSLLREIKERIDLVGVPLVGYFFNRSAEGARRYGYGTYAGHGAKKG